MDQRCAQGNGQGWTHRLGVLAVCVSFVGCVSNQTRAVVDARPRVERVVWTLDERVLEKPQGEAASEVSARDAWREVASSIAGRGAAGVAKEASSPGELELLGEGPSQLDPGLGPVDLGYPLLVDLGAGDAPYDDGVETIYAEEKKRGGFSDTVIQVHWRHRLGPALSFHGGASMFRYQDLGIIEGLSDARFGWAVLGIQLQF